MLGFACKPLLSIAESTYHLVEPLSLSFVDGTAVKTTPAGDSVSSDAAKQLKDMKEKASESLEAEAPAAGVQCFPWSIACELAS